MKGPLPMAGLMQPLFATWVIAFLNTILLLASLFLILLVLIQRGKGGGLTGMFGGAGGSSAFGSRAGDFFTRLTIWTAAIWLLLVMFIINQTIVKGDPKNPDSVDSPG
jgi:preprotein translocase subunit SecG